MWGITWAAINSTAVLAVIPPLSPKVGLSSFNLSHTSGFLNCGSKNTPIFISKVFGWELAWKYHCTQHCQSSKKVKSHSDFKDYSFWPELAGHGLDLGPVRARICAGRHVRSVSGLRTSCPWNPSFESILAAVRTVQLAVFGCSSMAADSSIRPDKFSWFSSTARHAIVPPMLKWVQKWLCNVFSKRALIKYRSNTS